MAGLRDWLRRLLPPRETTATIAPAVPASPSPLRARSDEELVAGLRVDPRAKILDFADLETIPSGPGFSKLRIPGLPVWADAIAKRRAPDEPMAEPSNRVEPRFDERAILSCSAETRLALGPAVRAAMLEALVHSPAVRLGDGVAEAIVPTPRARERAVQDSVLTIARSFTGSEDVLDRILRWALEDDSDVMRRACVSWLLRNARETPRAWDVLKKSLESETDDGARLDIASAIGIDAANVIAHLAENAGTDVEVRARAISMLPTILGDEERLDAILLGLARTNGGMIHLAAVETIAAARRPLSRALIALLPSGKHIADAILRLADPASALAALQAAKTGEDVTTTLARIRIAGALGGREVVEPLRAFLSAGNPRELSGPTRKAIDDVKSRLTGSEGAVSVADPDAQGRLSPASRGGELSKTPASGALSDPSKKRG